MSESESSRRAQTLVDLLDLEELDRDLYRAFNFVESFTRDLFGGQIAAQVLRAAALTVPEGRCPHSLHGYFLRRGDAARPTILRVVRDRDGRFFSTRHVVAQQHGDAIFTASVSFHIREEGGDYPGRPLPDVPDPVVGFEPMVRNSALIVEVASRFPEVDDDAPWRPPRTFWARTRERLPEDPIIHACALAYVSDMGSGFSELEVRDLPPGGPSLDHAVWFHRPVRADDWLYNDLQPISAAGARGLYQGSIYDREGRLGATLVQEMFLRPNAPYWNSRGRR